MTNDRELFIADAVAMRCTVPGSRPSVVNNHGMNCQIAGPSSFIGIGDASNIYWSSTEGTGTKAWEVTLYYGEVREFQKVAVNSVWPVRGM